MGSNVSGAASSSALLVQAVPANMAAGISKLSSAAQEFESVLLGQWLQNAESSFGGVPGGDDDADSCGEQMEGFATQRLAGQLTASGGIGIARLVEGALLKVSRHQTAGVTSSSSSVESQRQVSMEEGIAQTRSATSAAQAYNIEAEHVQ